jgi:glycosyltransferase involved in cell wall biosynthesis
MSDSVQADVIVPVYRDTAMTMCCLESVLAHSGLSLRSLIVVNDASPDPDMGPALDKLALSDVRMLVRHNKDNVGFVATCNRGLARRGGDAVLLNSDTIVTPGWLDELVAVAHSDPRTACVSPLSNNATFYSVPKFAADTPADCVDWQVVRAACSGLPRWTEIPTSHGFCIYLRGQVLDLVGNLDLIFSPGYDEENDWVMRAQAMGFIAKRANHAFVYHLGSQSFRHEKLLLQERNSRILAERHPHYAPQVARFHYTLEAQLAAHAVRVESTGKMRVALDLRNLASTQVGTGTYAMGLGRALAALPDIELTMIVRHASQAGDIPGRLVAEEIMLADVDVIHKPAQIFDPTDLGLLFRSPSHLVITHLDLIAYRAQVVFPHQEVADRFRATSALALSAAQMTIAISEDARREIAGEFGLTMDEIAVTPLGVEVGNRADSPDDDKLVLSDLSLPRRFFLSVATDFPHKNLRNLIDAFTQLRRRWNSPGEPPGLVLVGSQTSIRDGSYRHIASEPIAGVTYLGAVTDSQLWALYRSTEALVFPSVYEGFGLPILEAMAAGTPVIALPLSSVPEVGGDTVLYTDGTSPMDLVRALEQVATDHELREELRRRGPLHAAQFRWETTARLTVDAYRSAVFQPSARSLRARRQLRDVLLSWASVGEYRVASLSTEVSAGESSEPAPLIEDSADLSCEPARLTDASANESSAHAA